MEEIIDKIIQIIQSYILNFFKFIKQLVEK